MVPSWRALVLAPALLVLGTGACGRTPPWLPCGEIIDDDGIPAPSCDHPGCEGAGGNTARLSLEPSNALIVLDRSCSMATQIDGRNKWSRAVEAVTGMLSDPRAQGIRWGLTLFPDGDTNPLQDPVLLPVASEQTDAIVAALLAALDRDDPWHPQQPGEPCYTNLDAVTDQLAGNDPFAGLDGTGHVILITDGLAGTRLAIQNLGTLNERDIPTFVVGFGDSVDPNALQDLGEAGGVPPSGSIAYYQAGLDDLGSALWQVLQSLRCRHALRLDPEDVDRMRVRTDDGQPVPRDDTGVQGWRYDPQTESLHFAGPACDLLLQGRISAIELGLVCE